MKNQYEKRTLQEALEQLNKAYEEFFNTLVEAFHLDTMLFLWNNDLQVWTGQWWWMDI